MKKSILKLIVGIAVFAATSAITQAQTAATTTAAPSTPPCKFDECVQQIRTPRIGSLGVQTCVCAMSISTTPLR